MHCKAFRRLKHKTQVFVAPEGDHYRTRLTHTLEVTGISRTVARALRLNEDLTEAIGLGHDVGHPPFGHIGEDVLDRAGRERFGRGFRHNEHSLRVVSVLEGLNLTEPVRDGILRHSQRRGRAGDARGQDRPAGGPDRLHQPRHRRRAARGRARARGPAGRGDRDPRPDRLRAHRHARPRPGRALRARPGTSCRARRSGRAMLSLRSFMFERVYLGPRARAEHAKIERVLRGLFEWFCEHPEELPAARRRVGGRARDRLSGRHDRPLRDPRLDRALRPAGPRALMARYTDESRERVRDAVDFAEIVGARTELKRAGVRAAAGPVPVPRRAHAVVRDRPGREALLLLRLRRGRRRLQVRHGDRGAGLRRGAGVAGRALPRAAGARDRGPARRGASASGASGCSRCWSARRPTTCACCGSRRRRRPRASTWRRAGCEEGALRAYRVGWAPDAWDRVVNGSRRAGYSEEELLAAGLAQRARGGAGLIDRFRGRITFPLADERGRVLGLRRAGDEARRQAEVPEHVRRRALPQGPDRLRRRPRPRGGGARPGASCSSRATRT